MHLTDDFLFQQEFMLSVSYAYLHFDYPFVLLYICSLGFLSSAAFLFLRQVLGWKLGLGEECIGALVDYPMFRSPFTYGLDLVLDSIRFLFSFVSSFLYRVSISFVIFRISFVTLCL